jgi:DNA-binding response OmpR family regulator
MPQTATLLLIASDAALNMVLASYFRDEGYRVVQIAEGMEGLRLVRAARPDLIIVDAALSADGAVSLCGLIRKETRAPLILLTSGADEFEQILGLDMGADLCMVKPLSLAELRARIRALLRRAERDRTPRAQALTIGDLRIDPGMRRAWLAGQELQLTPKEFELLAYLMRNRGVVVPRDQLLRDVWGGRVPPRSQTLDVHIRWLRQKVEPNPDQPVYIQTVRMIGYRFEGP